MCDVAPLLDVFEGHRQLDKIHWFILLLYQIISIERRKYMLQGVL
jgi:hypothetical protein